MKPFEILKLGGYFVSESLTFFRGDRDFFRLVAGSGMYILLVSCSIFDDFLIQSSFQKFVFLFLWNLDTYTVEGAIEHIGIGKFQYFISPLTAMLWLPNAAELTMVMMIGNLAVRHMSH